MTIVFFGGEPLWRRDLFSIARHARKHDFRLHLVTNGTLIDEAMAARIQPIGFQRVAVTLDGADAPSHDQFRGQPGAFQAAVDGLHHLREAGVPTQINATVTRHNAHQLNAMLTLAGQLGAAAFHAFLLVPVPCGIRIPDTEQLRGDEADHLLSWLYQRSLEVGFEIKVTCAQRPPHAHLPRSDHRRLGTPLIPAALLCLACSAHPGMCFISHQGEVYPGGYLPVSAGNLRHEKFFDIWNHAAQYSSLCTLSHTERSCPCGEYSSLCSGCSLCANPATPACFSPAERALPKPSLLM